MAAWRGPVRWGIVIPGTVLCLIFLALGVWQVQRLEWKRDRIARTQAAVTAAGPDVVVHDGRRLGCDGGSVFSPLPAVPVAQDARGLRVGVPAGWWSRLDVGHDLLVVGRLEHLWVGFCGWWPSIPLAAGHGADPNCRQGHWLAVS